MLDHTAPSAILDDLKRQRATLRDRLAALADTRARLHAAEADETAALAAVGEVGRLELAAMTAWAEAGAHGEPPAIDPGPRATATRQLAVAQAKAQAARGAGAEIEAQAGDLQRQAAALDGEIERAAVAVLLAQYGAERAELVRMATALRARAAAAFAAVRFVQEHAAAHQAAGRTEHAAPIFRALERLGRNPVLDGAPEIPEVVAAVPPWVERYGELVR